MKFEAHGSTDIGKMRRRNEDAFLVDPVNALFAVADGLGGLAAGDQASAMAIQILEQALQTAKTENRPPDFPRIFEKAHRAVQQLGLETASPHGAGTTLTVALLRENSVSLAHAGDTAAYRFAKDDWEKLTIDHTEAERFRRQHPGEPVPPIYEHTLTRCLGQPGDLETDLLTRPISSGQRLLLCSDGVTREIHPKEIHRHIMRADSPRQFVEELIQLANDRGGADNATAIAIFVQ